MKESDVPQDQSKSYEGHKRPLYVLDEKGVYAVASSSGWEAEVIVLDQAIEEFNRLAEVALQHVKDGSSSPIEYHMYSHRMDLSILAQSTGFFKWQVKRHMRPEIFTRLSAKKRQRYLNAFGINETQLVAIPE